MILHMIAFMVTEFDVDVLTDRLEFDSWRFGLGMQIPTNKLPFRIRRRNHR